MGSVTTAPLAMESSPVLDWGAGHDITPVSPLWAGRFEIVERSGRGGMGVVYRARDTQLPCELAIKVIHCGTENASSRRHMRSEASALALLNHPNVIPIVDIYETEDSVFVTMPLVENGTLRDWLGTPR